ncbi:hypothetical protein BD779DRAFT_317997 [Infundibulicybe gibba]|nr:hypothetical protein BD779DRAFT_317997 [Infundibulicybe gibba]
MSLVCILCVLVRRYLLFEPTTHGASSQVHTTPLALAPSSAPSSIDIPNGSRPHIPTQRKCWIDKARSVQRIRSTVQSRTASFGAALLVALGDRAEAVLPTPPRGEARRGKGGGRDIELLRSKNHPIS